MVGSSRIQLILSGYTFSPRQMWKIIILDWVQLCQMAGQNSAMKGMGELQEDANVKHKSFIATLWVNLKYLWHPVWWEQCQNPRTPVSFLKLLQDFPCSCSQPCHSPAFMPCRMFKGPSCSASSHVGRVFWRHLAWLCWLASTQDWFTPAGLPGCVCPALNMAGSDVCLQSTRGRLIHVFLLWLTTKCHLLLSTTSPP